MSTPTLAVIIVLLLLQLKNSWLLVRDKKEIDQLRRRVEQLEERLPEN